MRVLQGSYWEPLVRTYLADAQSKSGDHAGAEKNFQYVLEYAPRESRGYFAFAAAYMRQGQSAQAATIMRKALNIDPRQHRDRASLTDYPAPPSDLAEMADVFRDAKVPAEERPLKLSNEGLIRFHAGQEREARALFDQAVKEDRYNHGALLYLAVMDIQGRRFGEAKKRLLTAKQTTAGTHSITLMYVGWATLETGDVPSAQKSLEDVIDTEPTLVQANYMLGDLHRREKNVDKSVELFQKVIRADPDYLPAKRAMSELGR